MQEYNATLEWGPLGQPEAWRRPPQSFLQSFLQRFAETQSGSALAQPSRSQPAMVSPLFPAAPREAGQGILASGLDVAPSGDRAHECVTVCEAVDVGDSTVLVCETVCTDSAAKDATALPQDLQSDRMVVLQSDAASPEPAAQRPTGQQVGSLQKAGDRREPLAPAVLAPQASGQQPAEGRSGSGRTASVREQQLWVPSLDGVRKEGLRPVERAGPRGAALVGERMDAVLARPVLVPADPVTLAGQAARHLQRQQRLAPARLASCTALLQQTL